MSQILKILWASTWGKILLIALLVIIVGSWLLVKRAADKIRQQLLVISRQWPEFSGAAMECRARTVAELYFHGWNNRDMSPLEPHLTPEAYRRVVIELEHAVANGIHKTLKVKGASKAKLAQLVLPDGFQEASALVEMEVHFPNIFRYYGLGRGTFLFELKYADDGRWLVSSIKRDDAFLNFVEAKNDFDTSWLETNSLPKPHEETLTPERPMPVRNRIAGLNGSLLGYWGFLVFMLLFGVGTWYFASLFHAERNEDVALLEKGETVFAEVIKCEVNEEDDEDFSVFYRFQVPGRKEWFSYRNLFGETEGGVEIPHTEGEKAKASGQIRVRYDAEDPWTNVPADFVPMSQKKVLLLTAYFMALPVVFGIFILVKIVRKSSSSFSYFWKGWKPPVRSLRA